MKRKYYDKKVLNIGNKSFLLVRKSPLKKVTNFNGVLYLQTRQKWKMEEQEEEFVFLAFKIRFSWEFFPSEKTREQTN